jgi:RNA polymerase sigma factor (sigma-70 family)
MRDPVVRKSPMKRRPQGSNLLVGLTHLGPVPYGGTLFSCSLAALFSSWPFPILPVVPLPQSTDEQLLVQRLLARDEQALRLLQARYAGSLLTVLTRLVHDRELAEDVLQEGLLKVWMSIASYDPARGRLFTWMVRLCCNHAIDALRSPRHRFNKGNQPLEVAQQALAPASFNPEHIGLRELTLQLKPKQQQVIDLLYFGGCTQSEAAEQLGIPLATVKTRARAALVALAGLARVGRPHGQPASCLPDCSLRT